MANLEVLTNRVIRAEYAAQRAAFVRPNWFSRVMTILEGSEVRAPWISGVTSGMKARNGDGQTENPVAQYIDLDVVEYQDGVEIPVKDMRRDKTATLNRGMLLGELSDSEMEQWEDLYLALLTGGTSTLGYDGQYIFDTDHSDSGGSYTANQSNKINVDISALPVINHGTTTAPSIEELTWAALQAIEKMQSFRDSMGRYKNNNLKSVAVFLSNSMFTQAMATSKILTGYGASNVLNEVEKKAGVGIEWIPTPKLSAFTAHMVVVRTDVRRTLAVGLEETLESGIALKIYDENSDFFKDTERFKVEVRANRNVKVGDWRQACHVTLT